jgi:hypothetical protein
MLEGALKLHRLERKMTCLSQLFRSVHGACSLESGILCNEMDIGIAEVIHSMFELTKFDHCVGFLVLILC